MKDTSRPESFAEVYETYFHYIYLYVLSLAKDEHLAEEITQETLVRAMEHWGTFDGNCQIQTWLCAIAKNCYYSICRKEKKMDRGRHPAGQDAALSRQASGGSMGEVSSPFRRIRLWLGSGLVRGMAEIRAFV